MTDIEDRLATEEGLDEGLELLARIRAARSRCDWPRVKHGYELKRRRRNTLRIAVGYAAAVVAVAVGAMFWPDGGDEAGEAVVAEAVLMLPDGSQVALGGHGEWSKVAAVAGAEVFSGGGSVKYEAAEIPEQQLAAGNSTLIVPHQVQYDIVLEDGTHVWLNAGSRLEFPSVFPGTERRVTLEGEGYFEVAHDAGRPFVVEGGGQRLTVLGTVFNIYAYPYENTVTTLLSGSVSLKSAAGELELTPGGQATLDALSGVYDLREVDAGDFAEWKNGVFVVDNNSLEQVMNKLSRWYGVDVVFLTEDARRIVYLGTIPRYGDISDVLGRIEEISAVRFEYKNKTVKITM